MLGTLLLVRRGLCDDFIAFQVFRQFLVAYLASLLLPADNDFIADILRLLHRRIGQAFLQPRIAAEVELLEYDTSLKKRLWAGLQRMFM